MDLLQKSVRSYGKLHHFDEFGYVIRLHPCGKYHEIGRNFNFLSKG